MTGLAWPFTQERWCVWMHPVDWKVGGPGDHSGVPTLQGTSSTSDADKGNRLQKDGRCCGQYPSLSP